MVVHNVGGLTFVSIEQFHQIGGSQVPVGKGICPQIILKAGAKFKELVVQVNTRRNYLNF